MITLTNISFKYSRLEEGVIVWMERKIQPDFVPRLKKKFPMGGSLANINMEIRTVLLFR